MIWTTTYVYFGPLDAHLIVLFCLFWQSLRWWSAWVFNPFGCTSHHALCLLYLIGPTWSLHLQLALAHDEDDDLNIAHVFWSSNVWLMGHTVPSYIWYVLYLSSVLIEGACNPDLSLTMISEHLCLHFPDESLAHITFYHIASWRCVGYYCGSYFL